MQQLHHYTWLLSRWFLLILLVAIICSGLTFGICTYLIAPVYQASALIRVNGPVITNTGSSGTDVFSQEALAVGDAILVTSTDVLKAVAAEIPGQSVSQLQDEVNAAPQQGTQIIEVRAQAHTPQLAATIANTVVNVFIQTEVTQATASLKTLDSQLTQDLATTQDDITQAQAQLDKLKHSGASADQIAQQNTLIATYQANYNTYLASYHQLLAQKNQAQRALSVSQVAIPPNKPVSPSTTLDTIVAGGLAMVLMIALALLIDWLDTSIKTPEDVANLASLEPLGSVPVSKKPLLLVHQDKPSATSDVAIEQAFIILANGSRVLSDGHCAILVTSLRSGAGVTTIATNLAILLAQSGKRVMLVDAHLRQPALHKVFNRPDTRGLVDVLATDVHKFQERGIRSWLNLWDTPIPNLWLLPADAAPSPIRLLKRMRELRMLKDWLLNSGENPADRAFPGVVDVVIFDAPALRNESDAMALASIADSSILVVTAGKERSETVKKAGATLQRLGAPVLGVVVNRQTTKHRPYFYTGENHPRTVVEDDPALERVGELSLPRRALPGDTPSLFGDVNRHSGLPEQTISRPYETSSNPMERSMPPDRGR